MHIYNRIQLWQFQNQGKMPYFPFFFYSTDCNFVVRIEVYSLFSSVYNILHLPSRCNHACNAETKKRKSLGEKNKTASTLERLSSEFYSTVLYFFLPEWWLKTYQTAPGSPLKSLLRSSANLRFTWLDRLLRLCFAHCHLSSNIFVFWCISVWISSRTSLRCRICR